MEKFTPNQRFHAAGAALAGISGVFRSGARRSAYVLAAALIVFLGLSSRFEAAPVYEPVAAFETGPAVPDRASLLHFSDGNFYGTTPNDGYGLIYKMTPSGAITVLVHFTGKTGSAKGSAPYADLISDGNGSLWGTTRNGGAGDFGTIFKYNSSTGVLSTVVEFTGATGPAMGSYPDAALTIDGSGFLWGVTSQGGAAGEGTVFKLNASTGVLTTIKQFTESGTIKGGIPETALVSDGQGFFWGTTSSGGLGQFGQNGTIYKVDISSGVVTEVAEIADGQSPDTTLVSDGNGFFWGTTHYGGSAKFGTIYKVNVNTGALTKVVDFLGTAGGVFAAKGQYPTGNLVNDGNGYLWGTTQKGGAYNFGMLFKVNVSTGQFLPEVSFGFLNGASTLLTPCSGVVSDGSGSYWGTLQANGYQNFGGAYKFDTNAGVWTTVCSFTGRENQSDGRGFYGGVVGDGGGSLWGVSGGGSSNIGTVYSVTDNGQALRPVVEFSGGAMGGSPAPGLINGGNGFLFGAASSSSGVVYEINAGNGAFSAVAGLNGDTPPQARLAGDGNGFLWGTTIQGGTANRGVVFKVNPATGVTTIIASFTGTSGTAKGAPPYGELVSDGSGYLWGTTNAGGASNNGTVYKVNASTGAFTTLVEFAGFGGTPKGGNPVGGLAGDGLGNLWGTTTNGGATNLGTIYEINTSSGAFSTVYEFPSGNNLAAEPGAGLASDGNGFFWGTTQVGGPNGYGSIFKISTAGVFSKVFDFTGITGGTPGSQPSIGALFLETDGNLYGTTAQGGITSRGNPTDCGQIYRVRLGPTPVTGPASLITSTSATLNGTVNPNGLVSAISFQYGASPALSGAVAVNSGASPAGSAPLPFSAPITGLLPATTYYYRICGNNSDNQHTQLGAILSFTTAPNNSPVVTLLGANPVTIEAAAAYTDGGATATDPEDGPLTPVITSNSVVPNAPGAYSVTWTATDSLGATGSATRTVNVVDTTPPTITLTGANLMTIVQGSTFTDPGAVATDFVDGAVTVNMAGAVDANTLGAYALTYHASDAAGNAAAPKTRIVKVIGLLSYALGTNPASPASPQATIAAGKLTLTLSRNSAVNDVTLTVQAADGPGGPWTDLASSTAGAPFAALVSGVDVTETGPGPVIVQVTDAFAIGDPVHPQRFMRLRVEH